MNVDSVDVDWYDWIGIALVIIGALNWGLTGLGGFLDQNLNVVDLALGDMATVADGVYLIVGLAGIYAIYLSYQLYQAS